MVKNQFNLTKIVLSGTCLFLLLTGCQQAVSKGNEASLTTESIISDQEVALQNAVTIVPTNLATQTATSTWTPIPTAASSPTLPPTQTPLPSATVTPTSWPTLPADQAADKVLALLADNQNPDCLLPCWWRATPGQTLWQDIEPFLSSFAVEIEPFPERSVYVAIFPVGESINYRGKLNMAYKTNEVEIITDISVASVNTTGYDPRTMMTLYGVPDEVWLKTFSELLPGEMLPFQLIIVYQEQGISFRYYVNASGTPETVTACFEPGVVEEERPDLFPVGPRIYLWEPGQYKTIDEIANIPREIYYPLAEKTDLTPQTLYEKFTDPNGQPCIDTPAGLWIDS